MGHYFLDTQYYRLEILSKMYSNNGHIFGVRPMKEEQEQGFLIWICNIQNFVVDIPDYGTSIRWNCKTLCAQK